MGTPAEKSMQISNPKPMDFLALERKRVQWINQTPGGLDEYDCPDCLNRGYIAVLHDNGCRANRPCRCMAIRASRKRLRKSGLEDLVARYSFDAWKVREKWQRFALDLAHAYVDNPEGWLVLAGRPGTGKSHLCTAVTCELIQKGMDAQYMLWRDVSVQAKAVVNDDVSYAQIVEPLKRADVLYIDDFFKGDPTKADCNLAFELINARYMDQSKVTIISTEKTAAQIMGIDEAIGSRIYERSKGSYLDLSKAKNWRLE